MQMRSANGSFVYWTTRKQKEKYDRKIKAILEYLHKFNSLILRNVGEAKQVQLLFSLYSWLPLIYSGSKRVNSALQAAMENSEKLLAILMKLSTSILAGEERERLHICCMGASLKQSFILDKTLFTLWLMCLDEVFKLFSRCINE